MLQYIPNTLSISRLIIGIIFIFSGQINLYLFVFAALSDFFDGFFARQLNVESKIGKILDPLADKVFCLSVIVLLIINSKIPLVVLLISIIKDLIVIIGGIVIILQYKNVQIMPNIYGKIATTFQMLGCFLEIIDYSVFEIWICYMVCTSIALIMYIYAFFKNISV